MVLLQASLNLLFLTTSLRMQHFIAVGLDCCCFSFTIPGQNGGGFKSNGEGGDVSRHAHRLGSRSFPKQYIPMAFYLHSVLFAVTAPIFCHRRSSAAADLCTPRRKMIKTQK